MIRTRFRPSANGPLHFGGAYVARQNWTDAQSKGGKFLLIVDDVVPVFKYGASAALTVRMREHGEAFRRDLEWLDWAPDEMHFASEFAEAHHVAAEVLGCNPCAYPNGPCLQRNVMAMHETGLTSSYHPWLTAGRVTDDHELGVTEFVRGGDLVGEVQLYDHFARTLYGEGYRILQEYMEIIIEPDNGNVCSKSDGTAGIADYREAGVTAEQVREALANLLELPATYGNAQPSYRQVDAKYLRPAKRKGR